MFTSTTTSEYSILDCPPLIRPLPMDSTTTTTKWRYNNIEIAPNCPRCASSNTKFCYYNNYSLSQPRYFCKGCRRYWTKGGSLRNVPVGGGCRKSRRARATRPNMGPNYNGPTTGPISTGPTNELETTGTGIDMAAVFAKYVNQDAENEETSSPGASFSSSDNNVDSQVEDITMFHDYRQQLPFDDHYLINGVDRVQQVVPEINGGDFVYHDDVSGFEMQGVLGDELGGDVLWSSDGSDLSSFGTQQAMVQLQDFGLFSGGDDQLRSGGNLVSDNWGSFDLSAYEIFSRP